MIFLMLINLYTSRLVLSALGVEDYGIYNVVGGVVAMFGFINGALATGTQRYITFELGKGNLERLKKVFITSIHIHLLISLVVIILAESVGLWFLYNKMTIPESRMAAAVWVYQLSIISAVVLFISVPYNALIIAHEKMSAFAYISIGDAVLKLLIAMALLFSDFDRLVLYACLMVCEQVIIRIIYRIYCKKHFLEAVYRIQFDKRLFREMLTFSGWNLWGSTASVVMGQGLNILLNIFFGPAVNAARGIATQVQGAVSQFAISFQTAMNPQIVKSYASQELEYLHSLVYRSSRFSFCLLFCVCLPIFMETDMLLGFWLKEVPEYTSVFLKLALCATVIQSVSNPLMTSAQATGKVKVYQSVVGGILILVLPIAYIVLRLGGNPISVFIAEIIICVFAFIARLIIIRPLIGLNLYSFFTNVICRCFLVMVLASIIPIMLKFWIDASITTSIIVCAVSVLSVCVFTLIVGMTVNEKKVMLFKLQNLLSCRK